MTSNRFDPYLPPVEIEGLFNWDNWNSQYWTEAVDDDGNTRFIDIGLLNVTEQMKEAYPGVENKGFRNAAIMCFIFYRVSLPVDRPEEDELTWIYRPAVTHCDRCHGLHEVILVGVDEVETLTEKGSLNIPEVESHKHALIEDVELFYNTYVKPYK